MMFHRIPAKFILLTIAMLFPGHLLAGQLPQPTGKVILTVSGKIQNTNAEGVARFDRAMLEALGVVKLTTSTDWTDGRPVFEGPPVRALLEAVGSQGTTAKAVALNDYAIDIPLGDFLNYPVILALKMDGKTMRVRDKGPIWIVYPQDDHPELKTQDYRSRWIWQLKSLEIR